MKRVLVRALGMVFITLLAERVASAQDEVELGHHKQYASPQHFALELRFAPYWPNIDSEPSLNGARPYHETFGDRPWARLLVALARAVPWHASHLELSAPREARRLVAGNRYPPEIVRRLLRGRFCRGPDDD